MLSPVAQKIIQNFLSLPFPKHNGVSCPYYNNKRAQMRGGLRVLIGKGSPEDIAEEALIISLKEKVDLNQMTSDQIKHFLVDNKIGIDCSGLIYYVVDAELKSRGHGGLASRLHFPTTKNLLRKLLFKLRPIENTSVQIFAHPTNSTPVKLSDARAGDYICLLGTGEKHDYDHIMLIHDTRQENGQTIISYTHSIPWLIDGKYNHGVRQGKISITKPESNLIEQNWQEQDKTGSANETFALRAKTAQICSIYRLKALE